MCEQGKQTLECVKRTITIARDSKGPETNGRVHKLEGNRLIDYIERGRLNTV